MTSSSSDGQVWGEASSSALSNHLMNLVLSSYRGSKVLGGAS
ncbi:hypothetical protein PF003_g2556 [Phytophthora fragariae]|nr:hypothetical protein PF003_g2556 [Phytophthora fragariae]